jgi:outer membrane protein assembly factor BamB
VGRRLAFGVALAAIATGCGSTERSAHPPPPPPPPPPAKELTPRPQAVTVRLVDGDTGEPIPGAVVRALGQRSRAGSGGVARLQLARRTPLRVTATAFRYTSRSVRFEFDRYRAVTLRLYRPDGQWTMYGVTPARTQAQDAIPLRPPFRIAWGRSLGGLLEFPAVVSNGVAYVSNNAGTLFALSMDDGRTLWRFRLGHSGEASSPAVFGDDLVAHGKGGRVFLLDRHNGRLRWSFATAGEIESSPVVRKGVDYFGDWAGNVYALDLRRRRLRWAYYGGAKITASATLAGPTVYVGDYAGRLLALDAETGRLRFAVSAGSPVYGASAAAAGRIFVPSRDTGAVVAFSTSGRYLWQRSTGSYVYSAPAVWKGRVFFGSYNGLLYCVAARTGDLQWTVPMGGRVSGSPVVVGGVVYAGSFAHRIVGVDARSGKVLFRFPHGEYVPVSGNRGRLLLHGWSSLWAVEPARRVLATGGRGSPGFSTGGRSTRP